MKKLNVMVIIPWMPDKCLDMINDVDPSVTVLDARKFYGEERLGDFSSEKQFDELLLRTDVILGHWPPKNVIRRAPNLKWYQAGSAGLDKTLDADMVKSNVPVTNASGIHGPGIAEYTIGVILMLAKQFPQYVLRQQEKQWKKYPAMLIRSKTLGVVGLGHIGREVAYLAAALGMRVIAIGNLADHPSYIDKMLSREELPKLLAESDFVSLNMPLTPASHKMIGEKELRVMKHTAYLINTARGGVVDEEALTLALEKNWIAGACLDCFSGEKALPTQSKLWVLPNVIVTPDISGSSFVDTNIEPFQPGIEMPELSTDTYEIRVAEIFIDNLKRFLKNEPLFNVVDKQKLLYQGMVS